MFCPKCGSILIPKKENNKKILACPSCDYNTKDTSVANVTENIDEQKEIQVIEEDFEANPIVDQKCEKCGNKEASFWLVQTRAADEPQTKFFKCTKCKHVWRDYD
ncbi:MAG: transcription factor S [archaeon]